MATSLRESLAGKSTSAHNWTHGSSRSFAGKQSRSTRIHEALGPACRDGLVSKTGSLRHVFWTCRRRRHILTTCRKNRLSATRLNGRRGGRTCRTTICRLSHHRSTWDAADPPTKEALRYRHALLDGFATLPARPLCTATAELVCSRIKDATVQVRRVPGTALANDATAEVIYTPPEGEDRIRGLLANWERFLHGEDGAGDIDPLVRMAVAHYQFEAIHPFSDGNGRTGRVLNSLFLVEQQLLPLPILYLSRFIIARKADYYGLLLRVTRDAAWEPWILFMLQGIEETASWTTAKIGSIRQLMAEAVEHVRTTTPKIYSRELVDLVFEQPYCRIANVVEAGIAGRQAASRYLQALVSSGLLREQESGREKLFVNSRLLMLLTAETDAVELFRSASEDR